MSESPTAAKKTRKFPIKLELVEGDIEAEIELPDGPMRLVELAFEMVGLSGVVAGMAERQGKKIGREVSCRKGCGACCRQLVPVSPPEAAMIAEMVETMAEPDRSRYMERFAKIEETLAETELKEKIDHLMDPELTKDDHAKIADEYFRLQIPCPFLEEESCSIYENRPSICREYLVSSPPEMCDDPHTQPVKRLPCSVRLSEPLAWTWGKLMAESPQLVPLSLALAWDRKNPKTRRAGADSGALLEELLAGIARMANRSKKEAEKRDAEGDNGPSAANPQASHDRT